MSKVYDTEENRFEVLLQEKRHKELINKLGVVVNALSSKTDRAVVAAINGQGDKIGLLAKAIQDIINTELNQDKTVLLLQKIREDIIDSNNKVIEALENRILPDTFDLVKYQGITQSVKVNYKPANKIK
jgi:hypothetical protein